MNYKIRKTCRICGSKNLVQILDLGSTPLADRFVTDPTAPEDIFPLIVSVCTACWLVQQNVDVDDKILFGDDYGFFTASSPSSLAYFEDYANEVKSYFPNLLKGLVVEIASNDGTLLKHFQPESDVLGIDPIKPIAGKATAKGVFTLPIFFNEGSAKPIVNVYGKAKIIMANNVLAHVVDPADFIRGVKLLLDGNGVFIFEVQYLPHLLFNCEFDNVYHEHRSFFSLLPLTYLLNQSGLTIFSIEETSAQGGTIRVFARHGGLREVPFTDRYSLDKLETYQGLQARVNYLKDQIQGLLLHLQSLNKTIYGYAASAKSNTLLNVCKIGVDQLKYVVDKTPYKFGKFTPGTHIPIVEQGSVLDPDYYLLLVWNYLDGVLEREKEFREKGGKFIVPILPMPKIL
jgi:SAM-dependent methyltransferase